MPPNVFADDDDYSPQNEGFEIDEDYGRRLEHNRKREDLQRLEELKKKGVIDDEDSEEESESDDDDAGDPSEDRKFLDVLIKVKKKDPSIMNKDVKFFSSDESESEEDRVQKEEKKKKMYLKDVQAKHLLEDGPDFVEEEKFQTYNEKQEAWRQAVRDAFEGGESESDDDDLLRETEKEGDDIEEDEELMKKMDEYFGEEEELDEGKKFLKDYFAKQMWKEKEGKSGIEAELEKLEEDEDAIEMQEEYETNYRHEENAGEIVMGQSRKVEGSVRKKDSSRKAQRKSKEERMKIAEMERKEELKRLKNVKKKEIKEKMKKVLSVAGFEEGEECPLDAKDLDGEFDPDEYDQMMKAVFDDNYYGAEDTGLNSDEDDDDDGEKPDFDKEDELLGLPKDWDVTQGGDGFISTREKVLKLKENGTGNEEEEEEEEEEKREEGKRKRKKKPSLVQRANEALMDEFYKLDYEDTIGDLKTRFKYAKVQPNRYELDTEEILVLDDTELNQYVPLKKMAPYVEKDWEVNKYKVKEQKRKINELLEGNGKQDEKRHKKRKKSDVEETKPAEKADGEGEEAETSKLSRKAKRRRRQAEKKLPPNRMAAYGKSN